MDLPTRILPIGPGHSLWLPLDPKEDKQTWCLLDSTTSLAGGGAGSAWLKDIFSCSAGLRPYSHSIYPALMMSPSSSVASDSTWLPFRRIPFELKFFTMLLDPLKRTSRSGDFQDTQTKCNDDTAWYTSLALLVIHPVRKKHPKLKPFQNHLLAWTPSTNCWKRWKPTGAGNGRTSKCAREMVFRAASSGTNCCHKVAGWQARPIVRGSSYGFFFSLRERVLNLENCRKIVEIFLFLRLSYWNCSHLLLYQ